VLLVILLLLMLHLSDWKAAAHVLADALADTSAATMCVCTQSCQMYAPVRPLHACHVCLVAECVLQLRAENLRIMMRSCWQHTAT
jgi:hypothetical protein